MNRVFKDLWDYNKRSTIYSLTVLEEKEKKKKGRKDIQRNNDPNLPKVDENINLHIKED